MKIRTLVFVFGFVIAFASPAAEAEPPPASATPDPNKVEGRYKNRHVDRAPEKDDKKEKQTARRNPTQINYADYRDANGVKIPFRWTVARPSGRFTIQIDESQENVPVDDKTFEKASQAPPS